MRLIAHYDEVITKEPFSSLKQHLSLSLSITPTYSCSFSISYVKCIILAALIEIIDHTLTFNVYLIFGKNRFLEPLFFALFRFQNEINLKNRFFSLVVNGPIFDLACLMITDAFHLSIQPRFLSRTLALEPNLF